MGTVEPRGSILDQLAEDDSFIGEDDASSELRRRIILASQLEKSVGLGGAEEAYRKAQEQLGFFLEAIGKGKKVPESVLQRLKDIKTAVYDKMRDIQSLRPSQDDATLKIDGWAKKYSRVSRVGKRHLARQLSTAALNRTIKGTLSDKVLDHFDELYKSISQLPTPLDEMRKKRTPLTEASFLPPDKPIQQFEEWLNISLSEMDVVTVYRCALSAILKSANAKKEVASPVLDKKQQKQIEKEAKKLEKLKSKEEKKNKKMLSPPISPSPTLQMNSSDNIPDLVDLLRRAFNVDRDRHEKVVEEEKLNAFVREGDFRVRYQYLASTLIRYQSRSAEQPLSPQIEIILRKFVEIYDVDIYAGLVSLLCALAESFVSTSGHVDAVSNTLRAIRYNEENLTNDVYVTFKRTIELLQGHVSSCISGLRNSFPVDSKRSSEDLQSFLRFVKLLQDVKSDFTNVSEPFEVAMVSHLLRSTEIRYQVMYQYTSELLEESERDFALYSDDESKLTLIVDLIFEDLNDNVAPYAKAFQQFNIDIHRVMLEGYYEFYRVDLQQLLKRRKVDENLSRTFFSMISSTRIFSYRVSKQVKGYDIINMSDVFEPWITRWIDKTFDSLLKWTKDAVDADKWRPVEGMQHSSSAFDLICILRAPLSIISEVAYLQKDERFLILYAKRLDIIFSIYTDAIHNRCMQGATPQQHREQMTEDFYDGEGRRNRLGSTERRPIRQALRVISQGLRSPSITMTDQVTERDCIYVNNLQLIRCLLQEIEEEHNGKFVDSLDPSFRLLRKSLKRLLCATSFKVARHCRDTVKRIVKKDENVPGHSKDIRALLDYVDEQLSRCDDHMSPEIFRSFLTTLWESLVSEMISLIVPQDEQSDVLNEKQAMPVQSRFIDPLKFLFHANGVGLKMEKLNTGSSQFLSGLLGLYVVKTEALNELWDMLEENGMEMQPYGLQDQIALVLAVRKNTSVEKLKEKRRKSQPRKSTTR
ncbi:hypothetical protein PROFUN_00954 [Planoprotostelium fungivorum]|uniref:Uncharacterized protein n=1 Tax=Planoprotostelium fungivorum TaxID=1890364 RepID=A0A2P6N4B4_9EUKA|nr:hypothetical protein PROFUN_00954 [Planoprotostelium fungivorum]